VALADDPGPEFYLSDAQEPQSKMTLLARVSAGGSGFVDAARARIWTIDPNLPVSNVRPLNDILEANLSLYRGIIWVMGAFAIMAMLLMSLGVYAVVSYTTEQRRFEIGVRLALGAQHADVRRLVVCSGVGLGCAGVLLGVSGAYALARFASNMLYEVTPADPITYAGLALLLLAITIAAAWAPARRAQRVDPLTVLRVE
jgi:ABC-type antimicrobial peptide transport system permease subunit